MKRDVLTVYPIDGKTQTLTYERAKPSASKNTNSEPARPRNPTGSIVPVSNNIVGSWVLVSDETPKLYFTFSSDKTYEHGFVDNLADGKFSPMESGIYRVFQGLIQIGKRSPDSGSASEIEWGVMQKFSISNNVLTVFPPTDNGSFLKFNRVIR